MTQETPFVDGFRLIDGTTLNDVVANPVWSTASSVTATTGGTVTTSVRITETLTRVTSATLNAGVLLPQALPGQIAIINNSSANNIVVFAAGGSTVYGVPGNVGYTLNAGATQIFSAFATNVWDILYFPVASSPAGGSVGQVQYNNAGALGGFTVSGDGTLNTSSGVLTVTKTNNTAFSSLATTTPGTGVVTALGLAVSGSGSMALTTSPSFTTPTLGVASATSINKVAITAPATNATLTIGDTKTITFQDTLTFPTNGGVGTNGYFLQTDGSGNLTWAAGGGGGGGGSPGGASGQIQYNNAGSFGGSANLTWSSPTLTVGLQQTTQGKFVLANTAAGAFAVTLQSSNSATAAWTFTLPTTAGTSNQVLKTDGTGVMSWQTLGALATVTAGTGVATAAANAVNAADGFITYATFAPASGKVLTLSNTMTLAAGADSQTFTFPATGGTVTVLGNTTTGSGNLVLATSPTLTTPRLAGSSSGYTSFASANAGATNYTVTFPAEDMTVGFRNIPKNSQTSAYVLVAGDNGKYVSITTGGVTVNASVFSAGDVISIYNNSNATQTITQGTNVTLRLAGSATTGNRTLAVYGVATLLCDVGGANPVFVVSGSVT